MTNPLGRSFLSYKRARSAEAELLIAAQHDLGIPTWRDVDDLGGVPTEDQIKAVLRDPEMANAILWLTPEVASSLMVRNVEAPEILRRSRKRDGFFVVPAAAGGLGYTEAAAVLDSTFTVEDLTKWNLCKVAGDPIDFQEAAGIAERVLRERIFAIHQSLPEGEPVRLALHTRKAPADPKAALILDWRHRFEGREAKPGAWEDHLLPSLARVAKAIEELAPGRRLIATGLASLPAAVALGCELLAPRRLQISWEQYREDREPQLWDLRQPGEESGFRAKCTSGALGAKDLAVLLSVADEVEGGFKASRAGLPPFRANLTIWKEGGTPHDLESSGQAADLAYMVQRKIRKTLHEYPEILCVHLFMAAPLGLAMMIGQLLNNVPAVQMYEWVATSAGKTYRPAVRLQPSI